MDDKVLRQLQLTQLDILNVNEKFCREHDLKYSLCMSLAFSKTLLKDIESSLHGN